MAIIKKDRDPISLLNPESQKEMAELIGSQIDFLVSKGTILEDDSSLMRLKKTPFLYPITDIDRKRIEI